MSAELRTRVQQALDAHLAHQAEVLAASSPDLAPLLEAITELVAGGKRLRPAFCYWGWRGGGGEDCDGIVTVAASLELFQAAALIHDDVMDGSDTRRGRPSVHRRFASLHRQQGWLGSHEDFGVAGAILAGDLCLSWCDEMFESCGLPRLAQGRAVFDRMRTDVMLGQYLDMLEQVQSTTTVERARRVILLKSAKYSVLQPLQLGGVLAGASAELLQAYEAYGLALGEAFQLRDDLLGVFGDPSTTGKPAGDDLREGKRTVLVAVTLERATTEQAAALRRGLGDPHLDDAGVAELRELMTSCGAVEVVEQMIRDQSAAALASLGPVPSPAREALAELVSAATARVR